jgi:hypothetical protein
VSGRGDPLRSSTPVSGPSRVLSSLLLACLAAGASGCITRAIRTTVYDRDGIEVILRSEKRGMTPIEKHYQHPLRIAPVRMAYILSRIDLRRGSGADAKRVPAVPTDILFAIGDAAAVGLEKADPDQEVVVQAIRRDKHWGIFDRFYLTSLLFYVKNDLLYVQISRSDWEIPKTKGELVPETHVGEFPLDFRLVVDKGMTLSDQQTAAVEWQDPVFAKPSRTRVTATGKVVRRTILMESTDDTEFAPKPTLDIDLTPEQLRALADLEEQRQSGAVTETEYTTRRTEILRGKTAPGP